MPYDSRLINPKTFDDVGAVKLLQAQAETALAGGFYGTLGEPQTASPYLTRYLPKPQEEYSQKEIAKSAWERENEIGSFLASQQSGFKYNNEIDPEEPDFDIVDYIFNEVDNTNYAPYSENFLQFKNRKNAELYKKHLDKEFKNTEVLQNSGWSGLAWGIGAGLLSPINFIPVGGSVYKAYKSGQFAKGIALTAGIGAGTMATTEALLQGSQESRTLEESVMNVGAGTILAGVLGGASAGLSKQKFNKLAKKVEKDIQFDTADIKINPETQNVEIEPKSVGAMAIKDQNLIRKQYDEVYVPELKAKGENPLPFKDYLKNQTALVPTIVTDIAKVLKIDKLTNKIKIINNLNPIQRLTRTEYGVKPREFAEKLMKTGMFTNKNYDGIANAQSAEINKKTTLAKFNHNYKPVENKAYQDFKKRIKETGGSSADQLIKNDTQFFEAVSKAMINNDFIGIPEIDNLAKNARENVFQDLGKKAVDIGIFDETILTKAPTTAQSYFPRLFNKLKVIGKENELRDFLFNKIKNVLLPQIKNSELAKEKVLNSKILDLETQKIELEDKLAKAKASQDKIKEENISNTQITLNNLNPTGAVFVNYTPEVRANANLANNITTLDKTMEVSPDKIITIYRGAPKNQKEIVAGDFITTNKQLAKDYAGDGVVLSKKVKASEILDDINEPLGEEYIYKPKNTNINTSDIVINEIDIPAEYKDTFRLIIDDAIKNKTDLEDFVNVLNEQLPDSFDFPYNKMEKIYNKYVVKRELVYNQDEQLELLKIYQESSKTLKKIKLKSLFQAIKEYGGITLEDKDGEIKDLGITNKTLPGLVIRGRSYYQNKGGALTTKEVRQLSKIQNHTHDEVASYLQQQGYFWDKIPGEDYEEATSKDLYELITREASGIKQYSIYDLEKIEQKKAIEEAVYELEQSGINFKKLEEDIKIKKKKIKKQIQVADENVNKFIDAKTTAKIDGILAKTEINLLDRKIKNLKNKYIENQVAFRSKFDEIADEDSYIKEIVDDLVSTLKGEDRLGLVNDINIKINKRGPLKERTLKFIRDEELEPWLERDSRKVINYYANTLATDIEIARAFEGDLSLQNAIEDISAEYDAIKEKITTEAEQIKIDKEKRSVINDLNSVAKIMRGFYNPVNPDDIIIRSGRIAREYNYITKMGQVVVASLSDIARPIAKHGLKTWAKYLPELITNLKGIKLNVKDAKLGGNIYDIVAPDRMASFSGLHDKYASSSSTFERYIENISKFMSKTNLMPVWNDAMKSWSAVLSQQRIINNIKKYNSLDKKQIAYLAQNGIGKNDIALLQEQLKKYSYKEGGLFVANTEKWDNDRIRRIYYNALNTDIDSTIITMGAGDLPLIGNTELGKVVLQFKSFTFAATQQALISGLQQKDLAVLNGFISATSLGMLVYYFKKKMANKELSNDPIVWLSEGIDRSGFAGILAEYSHIADKVGLGVNSLLGIEQSSRYASRNIASSLLGPSISLIDDGAVTTRALTSGEINESDARAIRRMIPLNNHWLLTGAMDRLQENLPNQ